MSHDEYSEEEILCFIEDPPDQSRSNLGKRIEKRTVRICNFGILLSLLILSILSVVGMSGMFYLDYKYVGDGISKTHGTVTNRINLERIVDDRVPLEYVYTLEHREYFGVVWLNIETNHQSSSGIVPSQTNTTSNITESVVDVPEIMSTVDVRSMIMKLVGSTDSPTSLPTHLPTHAPTRQPTHLPTTHVPTRSPTAHPTLVPTVQPTPQPTPNIKLAEMGQMYPPGSLIKVYYLINQPGISTAIAPDYLHIKTELYMFKWFSFLITGSFLFMLLMAILLFFFRHKK